MNKWITDRIPKKSDADINTDCVWITQDDGYVSTWLYHGVCLGTPWMPMSKPEPYVKPRWKPDNMGKYWYFTTEYKTATNVWMDAPSDCGHYERYNCFQTQDQAEEAARRMREVLLNYHKELS